MDKMQVGYAIFSRRPGGDWARRTTFIAETQPGNTSDGRMARAREAAEASAAQWGRVESDTAFRIVPWAYADGEAWTSGRYDSRKLG